MIEIRQATTETDLDNVGHLYHAFRGWLTHTYPEIMDLFEAFFIELEAEILSLPGIYTPPAGSLLIATYNGVPVGTVGLADLGQNHCEMRRMFVNSQFRGIHIGRSLAETIINEARERGYAKMRLDTGPRHHAARGLYHSLGFQIDNYSNKATEMPEGVPEDLTGGLIFMALEL